MWINASQLLHYLHSAVAAIEVQSDVTFCLKNQPTFEPGCVTGVAVGG